MGALAARMTDRGLLERVAGPGRAVRHRLTAQGEQVRESGERLVDDVFMDSFAPLSPEELDDLGALLDRLAPPPGTHDSHRSGAAAHLP